MSQSKRSIFSKFRNVNAIQVQAPSPPNINENQAPSTPSPKTDSSSLRVSRLFSQLTETVPPGGNISVLDAVIVVVKGCFVRCRAGKNTRHVWLIVDANLTELFWSGALPRESAYALQKSAEINGFESVENLRNSSIIGNQVKLMDGGVPLLSITKIKCGDKDIVLEYQPKHDEDNRETVEILCDSRELAYTICRALCGLCVMCYNLPSISSKYKKSLTVSPSFSLIEDTLGGESITTRERGKGLYFTYLLGEGACAKVHLALWKDTGRFIAVKALSKTMIRKQQGRLPFRQKQGTPDGLQVVYHEARIMKSLDHKNIVKFYGVQEDESGKMIFMLMEFMPRGTLMESSKPDNTEPLSEKRALEAFVDVLCGMEYLHAQKVVHRDIKPDNLLLSASGTVKITDFGTSKLCKGHPDYEKDSAHEGHTSSNAMVGTPMFMAPENCVHEAAPDGPSDPYPSDIWSLGATLYFLVFGRGPFVSNSIFELQRMICTEPLTFPSDTISDDLKDLLMQMLERQPDKRPSASEITSHPWVINAYQQSSSTL
mmetsp:Transcript_1563/g.2809  ORF Transcript_1563/g.2809 Transcript_1563/m.2809 type:complete len:543 (-) Transcript_1563:63-1691(-)|eukprot:CAMPEP_0182444196 /NCGR_PEP_ID=MMETSP1172-20130603/2730_1 /TAXON_ID=708627 /ORGANISM="Timspurckia oligopyrenoides, Strain CCMP3278" /LENGTH=542 /DNA_ID=CAMNT_0024639707 /DNA_START=155 /DNA_END=1783 /DNA_ORIENTATION=+